MAAPVANPCDEVYVDLSRVDIEVDIESQPCIDVEVVETDITIENNTVANQGPKGEPGKDGDAGPMGPSGPPGSPGLAATVDCGPTVTGAPGSAASVVNAGTTTSALFDFTIPRGDVGPVGPQGQGIEIKGTVPTHASLPTTGNQPGDVWIAQDTGHGWSWNGTAWVDIGPIQGPKGDTGPSNVLTVSSTTTGAPGTNAAVSISGTSPSQSLAFTIPAGVDGTIGVDGAPGTAATVNAGTTTTGAPGTAASVTNTGTSSAAVFAFTIPRGDVGAVGAPGSAGTPGTPGTPGAAGANAWTLVTSASFTVPAYGGSVTVNAGDTSWVALGEWVYVDDAAGAGTAGQMTVTAKTPTTLTLFNPTPTTYPLASTSSDGLLRKVSGNTTDFVDGTNNCQPIIPQITSVRLRTYNSVGNCSFEVDQRLNSGSNPAGGVFVQDRWMIDRSVSAMAINHGAGSGPVSIPGTSFNITNSFRSFQLTTQQASLAAGDYHGFKQTLEGCNWRELSNDVTSITLLVKSDVANLKFAVSLRSPDATKTLVKLCTVPSSGVWTLIQLPNIPVPSGGNFSSAAGAQGYLMNIMLACGSTFMAPAADTWQNGNFLGAPGMSNWAASPVNTNFQIAFVQHEPGSICSTLMDKPFSQNYDECLRYYCKSYDYEVLPGTVSANGSAIATFSHPLAQPSNLAMFGDCRFPHNMAKVPTVTTYANSGNPNAADLTAPGFGGQIAISGVSASQRNIFAIVSSGSSTTGACIASCNYTADTGW